ncbi:hypothetical protein NEOC65_001524 [Neochlamydia sp. AcF65]|nr:hypothetical protein [Neochlamydia sp. AcF65]
MTARFIDVIYKTFEDNLIAKVNRKEKELAVEARN